MYFKQLKHKGDNFTYIIADDSGNTVVIDPSYNADAIIQVAETNRLNIKYIINTHDHGDHVFGNREVKLSCHAEIIAHKLAKIEKDRIVMDGDRMRLDGIIMDVIYTPGHTSDSICLLIENKLFTGDTLFRFSIGRYDMPGGDGRRLLDNIATKLMVLPGETIAYPGHGPETTIGAEKQSNPFLNM